MGKFLTNPQDFHKSDVNFHEILWPPTPSPLKFSLNPSPLPKIFGRDHVWKDLFFGGVLYPKLNRKEKLKNNLKLQKREIKE